MKQHSAQKMNRYLYWIVDDMNSNLIGPDSGQASHEVANEECMRLLGPNNIFPG